FKSISHVVMHFKSIRDTNGEIVDFKILFVNERVNPITGDLPEDVKNKKISKIFPDIFKNGVFEHLVNAIKLNRPEQYEVSHKKNGLSNWFCATTIKLGKVLTVTNRNITEEKEEANKINKLNQHLVRRNYILTVAEKLAKIGSIFWY